MVALALVLSQAEALRGWSGERSLLLLDDLQAELDAVRQAAVLEWVVSTGCQTLVSGTRWDAALSEQTPGWALFHVEHGGQISEGAAV